MGNPSGEAGATLVINGAPRPSRAGLPLRDALREAGIILPSACGGRGLCGMCRVRVEKGGQPHTPEELKRLAREELDLGWRLSCRVVMDSTVAVLLNEEELNAPLREARVAAIRDLNYDTKRFTFSFDGPPFNFHAGQFVQIEVPSQTSGGETVHRAYSIASDPADSTGIDLIVRRVPSGRSTSYLHDRLKVGDSVKLSGPHGLFRLRPTSSPALFIAGGSGIAPLEAMLLEARRVARAKPITLVFGGVSSDDLYDLELIKSLGDGLENFTFLPTISGEDRTGCWKGERGLVTEVIGRQGFDYGALEVYLCGSPGMIDACVRSLTAMGVAPSRIYFDRFG